jgi:hypothetical protein
VAPFRGARALRTLLSLRGAALRLLRSGAIAFPIVRRAFRTAHAARLFFKTYFICGACGGRMRDVKITFAGVRVRTPTVPLKQTLA